MSHIISKPNKFIKPRFEWKPKHIAGHPLSQGLVGHWLFNEGAGNKVYDLSEFRNHGTLENFGFDSSGGWQAGQWGTTLRFDGTDDFVDAGTTLNMRLNDWAVSVWFRTTDTHLSLVAKSLYGVAVGRWAIYYSGGSLTVMMAASNGEGVVASWSTTSILDDRWHHVVGIWDRDGLMSLYCDSVFRASYDISPYSSIDSNTPYYLLFGKYNDPYGGKTDSYAPLNGFIDDIRIYKRVLSPSEIWQLYTDPFCDLEVSVYRKYWYVTEEAPSFNPAWAKQSNVFIGHGAIL